MGAPKGNKNAVGNSGGGRESAYKELAEAKWHVQKWEEETDLAELAKKIASGVYSVREKFLYEALRAGGKERLKMADKILPDRAVEDGTGKSFAALETLFRSLNGHKEDTDNA